MIGFVLKKKNPNRKNKAKPLVQKKRIEKTRWEINDRNAVF
jgi:hypothetical protein